MYVCMYVKHREPNQTSGIFYERELRTVISLTAVENPGFCFKVT